MIAYCNLFAELSSFPASFQVRFTYAQRMWMMVMYEIDIQYKHFAGAGRWRAVTGWRTFKGLVRVSVLNAKLIV